MKSQISASSCRRCRLFALSILVLAAAAGTALAQDALFCDDKEYVENVYLTTGYAPAQADVVVSGENMLACTSGKYALCYYSGPDPMPCTVNSEGYAECQCQVFEATEEHPMYVDINSILNTCIYIETTTQCGKYGQGVPGGYCQNLGKKYGDAIAIVEPSLCEYIAKGTFDRNADYISTFSFKTVTAPDGTVMELGCHDCEKSRYAGCMTASCSGTTTTDGRVYTTCKCPTYDGAFQYGNRAVKSCTLDSGQVWSAAYNPAGCPSVFTPPK